MTTTGTGTGTGTTAGPNGPLRPHGPTARPRTGRAAAAGRSSYGIPTAARTHWRPRYAPGSTATASPNRAGPTPPRNGPPGTSPRAEECAAGRTDLVVACGGDGTVRACADVVAGTGVPLALVPCGTGNLLARNLGLPTDPATALDEALDGDDFGIDVGRVEGDGLAAGRFTVMAGAGFDAAMVRDASPALKSRLGWPAYALSAARHLGDPRMRVTLRIDGGRRIRRRARMVVIGNVGTLQAGVELLPRARPDSGRLEVVLFAPQGPAGWLAAAAHLASRLVRRPAATAGPVASDGRVSAAAGSLEYFAATRVEVRFARPQSREVDGDAVGEGTGLTVTVEPGALRMRLPRPPGADAPLRVTAGGARPAHAAHR
ncbi:diacylglycerol/lipid kinase family protein [Streptomyces sp. NPDC004311]|uniref:diacylglycerol/lipid kinase family protein n=1 Tax=Streptomyces sp. NPDC004311 TaxID=3364698 RepID=UPI0036ABBB25